jgi:hypothetical protein
MAPEDWPDDYHSQRMVHELLAPGKIQRTKAGKRKLRLFACACCRAAWSVIPDPRLRSAVEIAERFADGAAALDEMEGAMRGLEHFSHDSGRPGARAVEAIIASDMVGYATHKQASNAAFCMTATQRPLAGQALGRLKGDKAICQLIRDIFGNPFRPAVLEPRFRTRSIVGLARAAYEERLLPSGLLDATRLGVLADALEEAGAPEQAVSHLRSEGPHVRGCWVVDIINTNERPRP